jgi:hypothetical protein
MNIGIKHQKFCKFNLIMMLRKVTQNFFCQAPKVVSSFASILKQGEIRENKVDKQKL